MAIAEEAEKESHGERGGGRGASAGSQRGADTSPPPTRKKGMKRLGQSIDLVLESPISLYHNYYCFPTINCRKFSIPSIPRRRGWGGLFKSFPY